ncbi:MAG: hypothetical protein CM1200mP2_35890 [Planctomycetaceae bacterium]|nr:MAG: hypothetical protein CM1200mP2_35890 [Planctomycetaceae bacterium]
MKQGGLGCGVIYQAARTGSDSGDAVPASLPAVFRDFLVESNRRFPELAGELKDLTGVDIELDSGPGLLFLMQTARQQAVVDNIARGLPEGFVLEILSPEEVGELEPAVCREIVGGALLPGEDQVNPMMLAEAYKRAALANGARFQGKTVWSTRYFERTGRVVGVRMGEETVTCGHVVNAAGAWAGQLAATARETPPPVEPVRGQVVLTQALPPLIASCLSTSSCYLAQKRHGEILIGSTTEHVGFDTGVTEEGIRGLCRGAVGAVPALADVGVKRVWAGLRPGTPDEMPKLGPGGRSRRVRQRRRRIPHGHRCRTIDGTGHRPGDRRRNAGCCHRTLSGRAIRRVTRPAREVTSPGSKSRSAWHTPSCPARHRWRWKESPEHQTPAARRGHAPTHRPGPWREPREPAARCAALSQRPSRSPSRLAERSRPPCLRPGQDRWHNH